MRSIECWRRILGCQPVTAKKESHVINKVILVGRLGKDPEVRSVPSGQTVTKFTMATDERFTDKQGEKQERTEWHNIVAWGKLGEICGQIKDPKRNGGKSLADIVHHMAEDELVG